MHRKPNQVVFNPFKHRVNPVKNWKDLEIDHPIKLALGQGTTPDFSMVLDPAMLIEKKEKKVDKKHTAKERHVTNKVVGRTADQSGVRVENARSYLDNVQPIRVKKRGLGIDAQLSEEKEPKRWSRRCIGGARRNYSPIPTVPQKGSAFAQHVLDLTTEEDDVQASCSDLCEPQPVEPCSKRVAKFDDLAFQKALQDAEEANRGAITAEGRAGEAEKQLDIAKRGFVDRLRVQNTLHARKIERLTQQLQGQEYSIAQKDGMIRAQAAIEEENLIVEAWTNLTIEALKNREKAYIDALVEKDGLIGSLKERRLQDAEMSTSCVSMCQKIADFMEGELKRDGKLSADEQSQRKQALASGHLSLAALHPGAGGERRTHVESSSHRTKCIQRTRDELGSILIE